MSAEPDPKQEGLVLLEGTLERSIHQGEEISLALTSAHPSDQNPVAVYLGRLAPGSRRTMIHALNSIARGLTSDRCDIKSLDWTRLRYQHTAAIRAHLAEKHAPATVNKSLSALRGVLKECWRLGYILAEDYTRAADLPAVRGTSLPHGRALSMGELATLFEGCANDPGPAGARDAALLSVLFRHALRQRASRQTRAAYCRLNAASISRSRSTYCFFSTVTQTESMRPP